MYTMCPPGCYHNGFMATPELGHILYWLVPKGLFSQIYITQLKAKYIIMIER